MSCTSSIRHWPSRRFTPFRSSIQPLTRSIGLDTRISSYRVLAASPQIPGVRHSSGATATSSTSSADPTEAAHFSRLASSWWDPLGPSRLLHKMNPLRHAFIESCLEPTDSDVESPEGFSSRSYLDVGCGGGIFSESAARLTTTSRVLAVDSTPSVLAVAKQHQKLDPALTRSSPSNRTRPLLYYECSTIEDLPSPTSVEDQFDVVTLFEVLEHISEPAAILEAATKHIKPGGWLILSTIARHPLSYVTTKLFAEGLLRIVPWGTHDWSKYINPSELRGWFNSQKDASGNHQWGQVKVQGLSYVPGYGWITIKGGENVGNFLMGTRRAMDPVS